MKKLFVLALLAVLFYSCDNNSSSNDDSGNSYVNEWIYQNMSTYYLWNDNITSKSSLALSSNPEDFFYSLLYQYGKVDGDRFSWIQEDYVELLNSLSGVSSYDAGFEYVGYLESEGSSNVIAQVAYVKPGTNAEAQGVKRGDYFNKVNGTQLTTSNWRNLFSSATANITFNRSGVTQEKNITLSVSYSENPVYLDTIYSEGADKVGYLVYNFFAADNGNESGAYNIELNEAFGKFKAANIKYLILDFRYNNGGSMNSATLLGSMIVPNLSTSKVFTKLEYNSILKNTLGSGALTDYFRDKIETGRSTSYPINNVGNNLQGLYILTGNWTASASELVINNLKPYMSNIYLIGTTTVGKNVGSFSIYEENDPKNKWGMQPIVLKYFNSNGTADFLSGFTPNVEEKDNSLNKLELGDKNEIMLSIALNMIANNGSYVPSSARQSVMGPQHIPIGSSIEKKAWANQVIADFNQLK